MKDLVTMQALRSWRNDAEEGTVRRNDRIVVSERRARQLEAKRPPLARRVKVSGPTRTKPVGPDTVKVLPRAEREPGKPVRFEHRGGSWYTLLDADGNEVGKIQGKEAAEEAVS